MPPNDSAAQARRASEGTRRPLAGASGLCAAESRTLIQRGDARDGGASPDGPEAVADLDVGELCRLAVLPVARLGVGVEGEPLLAHEALVGVGLGKLDALLVAVDAVHPVVFLVVVQEVHLVLDVGEPDPLALG